MESTKKKKQNKGTRYSAKVVPPRAGGLKVGVFSTRSPHRPNPIGLSLCKVEAIDPKTRTLVLLGLDLVDGTPVYDVKPYIPWDSVAREDIRVPGWVKAEDDCFAAVTFSSEAVASVAAARAKGVLLPLYPPLSAASPTLDASQCEVCLAICEVIAQDPRALHDGRGRATSEAYGMTFNGLRVAFEVRIPEADGPGSAVVVAAQVDPGDTTAPAGSYQHSVALRRSAEMEAAHNRRKPLAWKQPVREGVVEGLFDLRGGGTWKSCV